MKLNNKKLFWKKATQKIVLILTLISFSFFSIPPQTTRAINQFYIDNDINYYDENSFICNTSSNSINEIGTDYTGEKILGEAEEALLAQNQSIYYQAASEYDIPWQMLAAIHYRETRLVRRNPSNGDGAYQILGGNYTPTGEIDEAEFLRQSRIAAEFIKGKASANLQANRNLTANSEPDVIKDTFFSYNGRASVYAQQAASLGYDSSTQPFEGSPYVMNRADAARDPLSEASVGRWGQIKTDGGPIEYPANRDYGSYVIYAAIAGVSIDGCDTVLSGTIREKVVTLARQELELWNNQTLKGNGTDYKRYTNGGTGNWCAWFVSWVYNKAGYPLVTSNNGAVAAVNTIKQIGQEGGNFSWHDKGSYTPRIGDIVVQTNNASHVNIVVAVSGDNITTIGGNQVTNSFTTSLVSQYTLKINDASTSGYVSINN